MTGWRIGYAGGPEELIKAMANDPVAEHLEPVLDQPGGGGRGAQRRRRTSSRAQRRIFKERRDLVVDMLNEAPGHPLPPARGRVLRLSRPAPARSARKTPQGKAIGTDEDFATYLLEAEGVAVVQGAAFGLSPYFRISYATSTERWTRPARASSAPARR